jgi:chaperonin cofactor prefoldin
MNQLHTNNLADASGRSFNTPERCTDRAGLIKQIGRLRIQLHELKFLGEPQERSEFLRKEISILKDQIDSLRKGADLY